MSTINNDDIQIVPSNEHAQSTTDVVVTHQPTSTSVQINTQTIPNSLQYPLSSLNETMPITVVYDPKTNPQSLRHAILEIREFTTWSIFNMIFCCIILGAFALHMSCTIKKRKRHGNLIQARDFSKLAVLLNIIATVSGILMYTLAILRYTGRIIM
jgi:hypothetical protein